MRNNEFNYIDDPKTPRVIKPVTKLHDELVEGYYNGKDLKLPKLIRRIEKNLGQQVEELVKLEDQLQTSVMSLVKALDLLRALQDEDKEITKFRDVKLKKDVGNFIEETSEDIMKSIIDTYLDGRHLKNENNNEDI